MTREVTKLSGVGATGRDLQGGVRTVNWGSLIRNNQTVLHRIISPTITEDIMTGVLFVSLYVCEQNKSKSCGRISMIKSSRHVTFSQIIRELIRLTGC